MTPKLRRGFTLIELMISITIMLIAVMAVTALLVAGVSVGQNAQNLSDDQDNARLGAQMMIKDIRAAGLFTPGGVWVYASAPVLVNPVFSVDATATNAVTTLSGTWPQANWADDLYVIVPDDMALRQGCSDPGAMIPLATASAPSTSLNIACPWTTSSPSWLGNNGTYNDQLIVSNMQTGALLNSTAGWTFTKDNVTPPITTISGIDNGGSFSDTGSGGAGYQVRDLMYRANVYHYFITLNPATNRPALVKWRQVPSSSTTAPFTNDPNWATPTVVQDSVEDLQFAFEVDSAGGGDPTAYTVYPTAGSAGGGFPVGFTSGLRSIRVNLVSVGRFADKDTQGTKGSSANLAPINPLEDHNATETVDGYRRSLYTERVELPNLAPGNL